MLEFKDTAYKYGLNAIFYILDLVGSQHTFDKIAELKEGKSTPLTMSYANVPGPRSRSLEFGDGSTSEWLIGMLPAIKSGMYVSTHFDNVKIAVFGDQAKINSKRFLELLEETMQESI